MGLLRSATACTCTGEETVAPSFGLETQTDPAELVPGVGGGSTAAGGNGATPLVGPALSVMVTVGHEAPGPLGGCGPVLEVILDEPPQPTNKANATRRINRVMKCAMRFFGQDSTAASRFLLRMRLLPFACTALVTESGEQPYVHATVVKPTMLVGNLRVLCHTAATWRTFCTA